MLINFHSGCVKNKRCRFFDTFLLRLFLVGVDGFGRRSRSGNTFENEYLFIPATALLILTSSIHAMNGESVRQQADFLLDGEENSFSDTYKNKKEIG